MAVEVLESQAIKCTHMVLSGGELVEFYRFCVVDFRAFSFQVHSLYTRKETQMKKTTETVKLSEVSQ